MKAVGARVRSGDDLDGDSSLPALGHAQLVAIGEERVGERLQRIDDRHHKPPSAL